MNADIKEQIMKNFFRESGIPSSTLTASTDASVDLIAPPGSGKAIVIVDILSHAISSFKDVPSVNYVVPPAASIGAGNIILHVGAGASNLSSPIKLAENTGLQQDSVNKVTVIYYIEDL